MKPTEHPLENALQARVRLLETTLQPSSISSYRHTVRLFLEYLQETFPEVRKPSQLRRDPHLLGWLEFLWKLRTPAGSPLNSATRGQHVMRLRTLLDLLADLPQPPMPGLLRGQDIPPRQYRLPRPLTPEDDARLQQHWAAATDLLSSALLLQRLTGMRIGELVDLAPDGLRHLGDNRWSLHVPHGKPRSERWVPVDDQVRLVVERLSFLRTLPPGAEPRFLLPRPKGREVLMGTLRKSLCEAAERVGIPDPPGSASTPSYLRHDDGSRGDELACLDEITGTSQCQHDLAVCRSDPTGPATRVSNRSPPTAPPGARSSRAANRHLDDGLRRGPRRRSCTRFRS